MSQSYVSGYEIAIFWVTALFQASLFFFAIPDIIESKLLIRIESHITLYSCCGSTVRAHALVSQFYHRKAHRDAHLPRQGTRLLYNRQLDFARRVIHRNQRFSVFYFVNVCLTLLKFDIRPESEAQLLRGPLLVHAQVHVSCGRWYYMRHLRESCWFKWIINWLGW